MDKDIDLVLRAGGSGIRVESNANIIEGLDFVLAEFVQIQRKSET